MSYTQLVLHTLDDQWATPCALSVLQLLPPGWHHGSPSSCKTLDAAVLPERLALCTVILGILAGGIPGFRIVLCCFAYTTVWRRDVCLSVCSLFSFFCHTRRPDGSVGMALVLPALTDCRWWFESLLVHSGISSATRRKATAADQKKSFFCHTKGGPHRVSKKSADFRC